MLKIILLLIILVLSACSLKRVYQKETGDILSAVEATGRKLVSESDLESLPEPVKRWLHTTGIVGKPYISSGWIRQKAFMQMKPDRQKWYKADAEHCFTTKPPAFIWTVSLRMSPLIRIRGRDKFVDGKGEMLIRMNSLFNVVNAKGEKIDEGTIQRYLGELVWYPSFALSPYVIWEALDEHSAKATMSYQGTTGSGVFFFDGEGDFVKFSTKRYMDNKPGSERFEWVITVEEQGIRDGLRVPVKMDATWKLPEGDWQWLKLQIAEIRYNID